MRGVVDIAKALSDGNRVRATLFLRHGELCVCQIIEMLQLAPSTVSKHMSVLQQAGLVEARKEGRWHYYKRPDRPAKPARMALRWVDECLSDLPESKHDDKRLAAVLKKGLDELCAHYRS